MKTKQKTTPLLIYILLLIFIAQFSEVLCDAEELLVEYSSFVQIVEKPNVSNQGNVLSGFSGICEYCQCPCHLNGFSNVPVDIQSTLTLAFFVPTTQHIQIKYTINSLFKPPEFII